MLYTPLLFIFRCFSGWDGKSLLSWIFSLYRDTVNTPAFPVLSVLGLTKPASLGLTLYLLLYIYSFLPTYSLFRTLGKGNFDSVLT